jgi:two-component system, LytTR family, sensor kinase
LTRSAARPVFATNRTFWATNRRANSHLLGYNERVFKRDELGFPNFWTIQLVSWSCFYLLTFIVVLRDFKEAGTLFPNTVFFLIMFVFSFVLRPICRSLAKKGLPWIPLELRALAWSAPGAFLAAVGAELASPDSLFNWNETFFSTIQAAFVLFLWCSLYFSIKQWQQAVRERERLLRAEAEVREARLSALHYQLNPHFLFNSLNAVSTLVLEGNAPAATRMLAQIGELLRTTLDRETLPETPLHLELAFTEQYLAIEQTRLGGRLRVFKEVSPETLDARVPSMLLQPLVENAVRHGVAPSLEGGSIRITSALRGAQLCLTVQNSGAPLGKNAFPNGNGNGIGLANTLERLKTLYGSEYKLVLECPDEGGCCVIVELPFHKAEISEGVTACAR